MTGVIKLTRWDSSDALYLIIENIASFEPRGDGSVIDGYMVQESPEQIVDMIRQNNRYEVTLWQRRAQELKS